MKTKHPFYNLDKKKFFRVEDSEMGRILVSEDEKDLFLITALSSNKKDWKKKE